MITSSRIQFSICTLKMCLGKETQLDSEAVRGLKVSADLAGGALGYGGGGGVHHVQYPSSYFLTFWPFNKYAYNYQKSSKNKYLLLFCTSSETEKRPVGDGMV
jgi:hypothetical protein